MERDPAERVGGLDAPLGAHVPPGLCQRLAIVRVAVREHEWMVLDDLSRALDVEAERALWDRVFERPGLTCLVVSNRRPALRRADRIVVLREGRIAAVGTLEGLLETCGELQRIWQG
jgi:ATP-binding cassette subfamily B protein